MARYLVVEDSNVVVKILKHLAKATLGEDVVFATSMAAAQQAYQQHQHTLEVALVDLSLPDAPDGELVDYLLEQKLPVVVLTGSSDSHKRDILQAKGIADYVIKESRYSYQYALNMIRRLSHNRQVEVLVVEDSKMARKHIQLLLSLHCYHVHTAEDGVQAMKRLHQHPDIQLVITDYNMPNMDGFELVQAIRHEFEKRRIAIIGLSGQGDNHLSVRFIKNGANDFLNKPFEQEEFFCRVTNNIETITLLKEMEQQANRDFLTGLFNRRYFQDTAGELVTQANKANKPVSAAIIDVDHFKQINDEYGHQGGDAALVHIARLLNELTQPFLLARTGGEEFSLLMPGLNEVKAYEFADALRARVADGIVDVNDDAYTRVTISVGIATGTQAELDELLNRADVHLFQAKESGRNLVVGEQD
ncbi:diguanylate cyclase response regulator [Bacterioplanes sanyensis]|uniref:diguanylate cyclase n=1 Tax=Bacterioplanes sanyensis TaxID=1249553 RepID=A0A222FGQ4_9GAMM|nr:diguanylate cyclase [Bacterioplanes sanyensis]ASP38235.1 diguanylate cyclase response regulator [Bacterioplanes sanyensis]